MKTRYVLNLNGGGIDRMISRFASQNVQIFEMKRVGRQEIEIVVDGNSKKKIIAMPESENFNITTKKMKGYLELKVPVLCWLALLVALFISFSGCFLLSQKIYKINVNVVGNDVLAPKVCEQVQEILRKKDIVLSCNKKNVDINLLEQELFSEIDAVEYVEIEKNGMQIAIDVHLEAADLKLHVGNLVSTVEGIVSDTELFEGEVVVLKGQPVQKGQTLVSANAVSGNSKAKIKIRTWQTASITFFEQASSFELSGNFKTKTAFSFFGKKNDKLQLRKKFEFQQVVTETFLISENLLMPIYLTRVNYYELVENVQHINLQTEIENLKLKVFEKLKTMFDMEDSENVSYYVDYFEGGVKIDCSAEFVVLVE